MRVMCTNVRPPSTGFTRFTLFRVYAVSRVASLAVWVYDDTGAEVVLIERLRAPCKDAVYSTPLHAAQFVKVEE